MSHAALHALVQTDCMRRVGALACAPHKCVRSYGLHRKLGLHMHEDANVGLCMFLHRVRLLPCACFHMGMSFLPLPKASAELLLLPAPRSPHGTLHSGTAAAHPRGGGAPPLSIRRAIARQLRDGTPAAPLCRRPLALHPVTSAADYLGWWRVLELREAHAQQQ
eukprot:7375901-Prymnesium_polylepis.2